MLSTSDVADLLGVAKASVVNWINQEQLRAGQTPGGHRRVAVEDLIEFLQRQRLPIPPELVQTPPKVLIVDDEAEVRELIAGEIAAEFPNFEVFEAHDGFSAGTRIGSLKPDAVVLDLKIPGLDGYEVCRWMKANPDTKDIGVIAITANPSPKAAKQILECGARVCLNKPLDMEVLLKELDAAVQDRRRAARRGKE